MGLNCTPERLLGEFRESAAGPITVATFPNAVINPEGRVMTRTPLRDHDRLGGLLSPIQG